MYLIHRSSPNQTHITAPNRQQGVVLLVALIVLVALTLAGVALIRSVDTANLIAGNMSFHQSAVHAGERSTEQAINAWLLPKTIAKSTALYANELTEGYHAVREDPATGVSWDAFFSAIPADEKVVGSPDAAGNTVSYVIHRLCDTADAPHLTNCSKPPANANAGGSQGAGGPTQITNSQVYYRITTRIAGPRNTVAYIQTIVAL